MKMKYFKNRELITTFIKSKHESIIWTFPFLNIETYNKKSTNEIIFRHLASKLHIRASRDLTTACLIYVILLYSRLL